MLPRFWSEARARAALLYDIGAVYGIHFANQALPLVTVPYLSRVLGPEGWGLVAMAQAFGTYGNLIVDYGFVYSATREIATAGTKAEVEEIVDPGELDPDAIVTPGIFVTHILKGPHYDKRIERRTVRQLQAV